MINDYQLLMRSLNSLELLLLHILKFSPFLVLQLRISFNDAATSTYEYPSEQSLLEEMPPEPGDFDYIQQLHGKNHSTSEEPDVEDIMSPGTLKSTPGMGPGGRLATL